MRRLPTALLPLLVAAAALAGCGDDGTNTNTAASTTPTGPTPAVTGEGPVASTPSATTPPTDATAPLPQETTPAETTPEQTTTGGDDGAQGGDGGGQAEEPVRVPAAFKVLDGTRLTPPSVTVPPFLAVELSVANPDQQAHVVVVQSPRPQTLTLAGGGYRMVRIPGMRAGTYAITLDGRRAGQLLVGGEVGP
jgi:hypothetical protein